MQKELQEETPEEATPPPPKRRGGRPKHEPETVRGRTIGVRVSESEFAILKAKADTLATTPAHWLRQAALARRLPQPPVPAINRDQYAELARLAGNLNQIAKAANEGREVSVNDAVLEDLSLEVKRLRLALLGIKSADDC